MDPAFSWDPVKARANLAKHGVEFAEAAGVFRDTLSITLLDAAHSDREERFITIGMSPKNRLLVVVHTDIGDVIRIISARQATPREIRAYEESK